MKKNINIIKIKGMRGLFLAIGVICCLAAGFIAFPGWVCMHIWDAVSIHINGMPAIGLLQGILLWGIILASYFTFRKDKVLVCLKTPEGLSEEELKTVFADMKKQSYDDPVFQAMMKARETELKIQKPESEKSETIENNTKF